MERTDRGYRLSTGREFSANAGVIGLARHRLGGFTVGEGYDGSLDEAAGDSYYEENWTPAERVELADSMIALWQAFKSSHELKPCECGCGTVVEGGRIEAAHPEDYRDERG